MKKIFFLSTNRIFLYTRNKILRIIEAWMKPQSSLLLPSGSSSWFQFVSCHQFHGVRNLGHETTSCSGYHNHCGSFYMPSWLSASSETCNTQEKWSLSILYLWVYEIIFLWCWYHISSSNHGDTAHTQLVWPHSPGVNLPVEVVKALVELLDISLLPLNVRAVLLELGGNVVAAAFG